MILKLSDVNVGKPKNPTIWSNELQKYVDYSYDYKSAFISNIKKSNHKDVNWQNAHILDNIIFDCDTNQNFEMCIGLFSSNQIDVFMIPNFSSIIYNTTNFLK